MPSSFLSERPAILMMGSPADPPWALRSLITAIVKGRLCHRTGLNISLVCLQFGDLDIKSEVKGSGSCPKPSSGLKIDYSTHLPLLISFGHDIIQAPP